MYIQVVNPESGRRARLEARTLGKVLHLACFHDWHPERLEEAPPSASWSTEIIMPYVSPYLSGSVSAEDAANLTIGLKKVLASEGPGLATDVYLATLALASVAAQGRLVLELE